MEPNFERYRGVKQPSEVVYANLERARAERIFFKKVRPRLIELERAGKVKKKLRNERLLKLYDDAVFRGIDVDNIFEDTKAKREALESIMGYKNLRGVSSIEDASPAVIGEVYKKDFYAGRELE